jgi:ABC-type glycerol-3-phosphate transport system permease component
MIVGSRPLKKSISYIGLVFIGLIGVFPIAYLFLLSTKRRLDIGDVPPSLHIDWQVVIDNYKEVLLHREYITSTINSIIVTVIAVLISLLLGTPAAYVFSRVKFKNAERISTTILSLRFMPAVVVAIPILLMMRFIHAENTRQGLIIPYVASSLPLVIWMLIGFFDEIPKDIDEAAEIDGASRWRTLRHILVPLVRPGIVVAGIFAGIFIWNEFLVGIYIIDSSSLNTVPISDAGLISAQRPIDWNIAATVGVVTLVPLLIAAFAIQKHIVQGITSGSIK